MFAVLTDAVECFPKHLNAKSCASHKLFGEAQAWIASAESSWPFSFECICDALDLDLNYIRAGLRRWRCDHKLRNRTRKRARVVALSKARVLQDFQQTGRRAGHRLELGLARAERSPCKFACLMLSGADNRI